jgi:hypothetical protein
VDDELGGRVRVQDIDLNTETADTGQGGKAVIGGKESADTTDAVGQAAEEEGAVRDRLVAGHVDTAL